MAPKPLRGRAAAAAQAMARTTSVPPREHIFGVTAQTPTAVRRVDPQRIAAVPNVVVPEAAPGAVAQEPETMAARVLAARDRYAVLSHAARLPSGHLPSAHQNLQDIESTLIALGRPGRSPSGRLSAVQGRDFQDATEHDVQLLGYDNPQGHGLRGSTPKRRGIGQRRDVEVADDASDTAQQRVAWGQRQGSLSGGNFEKKAAGASVESSGPRVGESSLVALRKDVTRIEQLLLQSPALCGELTEGFGELLPPPLTVHHSARVHHRAQELDAFVDRVRGSIRRVEASTGETPSSPRDTDEGTPTCTSFSFSKELQLLRNSVRDMVQTGHAVQAHRWA